jgi:LmbE family N-acetylglucosaminyl deacetylase
MNKVLVIAPHLDDEALGCGGAILKHAANGCDVHVAFIAHRVYDHKFDAEKMAVELSHMEKAKSILGYKEYAYFDMPDEELDKHVQKVIINLEEYVYNIKPDIIYSPFFQDNHQDHRAVAEAIRVVLRPAAATFVKRWLIYETPSSTEQTPPMPGAFFQPNSYIDIKDVLDKKLDAFRCYETESREYPHPRSLEAIKHLAAKRGIEAAMEYAEAFMLMREKA